MAADGELYVEIMPSTKGVKKQIESDLDGSFSAAESKGQGALTRLGNGLVNFGKGVALTLAGVLAIAIKGGIDRQLKIEDAQAKLRGLGHDADSVKTIMTSALDAVKGTAYGLEEAATVAASAVAAGIKPGQELTKYLALTADAATIAGVSMGEMGAIINKVTSRGKADTEQLNQLAERGIPIFQWLADEYGVTQQELSKMVAQGKVDAETYRKVIEENIGGAALASGDTTRGAFKNMLAALSRLGVAMTSPAFGLFKTIFGEITVVIDYFTGILKGASDEVATGLGARIAEWLDGSGQRFIEWFQSANDGLGPLVQTFYQVASALSPLGLALDALVEAGPKLVEPLQQIGTVLAGALAQVLPVVAGALAQVVTVIVQMAAEALPVLLPPLLSLVSALVDALVPALDAVLPVIVLLAQTFAANFATVLPLVAGLIEQLIPIVVQLVEALGPILGAVVAALGPIFQSLTPILSTIATLFGDVLARVIPIVAEIIAALVPIIVELVNMLGPILTVVVEALAPILDVLAQVVLSVLDAVMPLVEALLPLLGVVLSLVEPLLDLVFAILQPLLDVLVPIVATIAEWVTVLVEFLVPILTTVVEWITVLVGWIADAIAWVVDFYTQWIGVWQGILDKVIGVITWIVNAYKGYVSAVWEGLQAIGGFFADVWQGIKDTVTGVVDWIADKFTTAKDTLVDLFTGIGDSIATTFKSAFNKVAGFWNDSVGDISFTVPSWVPGIGGNSWSLPDIPMLDAGGIVTRPTLAMIGERRPEVVLPLEELDQHLDGRGGVNFYNYAPTGQTAAEALADFTVKARATRWLK